MTTAAIAAMVFGTSLILSAGDAPPGTWTKLATEPYRGKQDDISFVTPDLGWYVNGGGKIYRTTDGGATWTKQIEKPGTFFRCIAFVDEQHGIAGNIGPDYFPGVTDTTPIYITSDGGTTWNPVPTESIKGPPVKGLCALEVVRKPFINSGILDHKVRIVGGGRVGGPVSFVTSDDLGQTWTSHDISAHCGMVLDVHFFDFDNGVIAAASDADVEKSHAVVLTTSDGGRSWTKAYESNRPFECTWKLSFPTRETGYVTIQSYNPDPAVSQRFVAKTTDGGKTWAEIPLVDDAKVREFGIAFIDERTGWIGAMPHGFATTDAGATWQRVDFGNAVNKIRLLRTDTGYVGYAIGVEIHKLVVER